MANDLKLEVILQAVDRLTAPLKRAVAGSTATARAVKDLRDRVKELNHIQRRTDGFKSQIEQARKSTEAIKAARTASENYQQKLIAHREVQAAVAAKVKAGRHEVSQLIQEMQRAETPTAQITARYTTAKAALEQLESQYNKAKTAGAKLREQIETANKTINKNMEVNKALSTQLRDRAKKLKEAGINTSNLTEHEKKLKAQLTATNAELALQEERLKRLNAQLARMQAARSRYERTLQARNRMAGAGTSMVAGGIVAGGPVVKAVKDYVSFEDAMLGVARQVQGARDASGKLTSTYYEMAAAIKNMATTIPMATTEIAAIVEAGARMGIQGRENLLEFARITAITATAFNLPADQIGDDMGQIAGLYKIPIKNIQELGDVINWLDDNALSKGADIIEVMKRLAAVADKLDFRKAAALGSTFLTLGASPQVAADAAKAMVRELAIASEQPKRYQKALKMLHLDPVKLQRDMTRDATGTLIRVLEAINQLKPEDQLAVTTQIWGKEYGDDAAKLAGNLAEYRRQLELVRAAEAKGSMQREADAKADTLSARWQMLTNRAFNLSSAIGETLKPTLAELMTAINGVLDSITAWTAANPELVSMLTHVAAIVAVAVTGLGGLALAVAAVLGPFALLRWALAVLGIKVSSMLVPLWRLARGALSILGRVLLWLGTSALPAVGRALLWLGMSVLPVVGRALMFIGPWRLLIMLIMLLVSAPAQAAQAWKKVVPWFTGLWARIKATWDGFWSGARLTWTLAAAELRQTWDGIKSWFATLWSAVRTSAIAQWDALVAYLAALPERMLAIGRDIVDGIIRGIQEKWQALKDMIGSIGDILPAWLREKLDTHSPSRVFAAIGGDLLAGLGVGMDGQQAPLLAQVGELAKRLAQAGAGIAIGTAPLSAGALPALPGARPPVAVATTGGAGGDQIVINVYPSAGMDERALAREVAMQLGRAKRSDAARGRSALYDEE
ncbi:MAG TPA: phage tail tape measure protein [Rhodocyclaceae bacterium]|uniref:phage tail tape measure protein n=1 Tax=Plasticicumulans sp. TaxID=2307179 RepID=UPI002CD38E3D|nr:phage tail tape measure protein [Rhodocyclaceae bacterium]